MELKKHLSNVVAVEEVADPHFNHLDFIYGKDVKKLVYDRVLKLASNFSSLPLPDHVDNSEYQLSKPLPPKCQTPQCRQSKFQQEKPQRPKYQQPIKQQSKKQQPKYQQPKHQQPKNQQSKYPHQNYQQQKYELPKSQQPKPQQPKNPQITNSEYPNPFNAWYKYLQSKYNQ